MFIGHIAVGLAAKKLAPKASLGILLMSVQFLDLLWPIFVLLGLEHLRVDPGNTAFTPLDFYDYPISHSLLTVVGWSVAFGFVSFLMTRDRISALVLGIGVLSHWVLDFISHRPDLPLAPGFDLLVGLGLWNSVPATIAVEFSMYALAVTLYLRTTTARERTGSLVFWSFVVFLFGLWVANIFVPPPPSAAAVAASALALWVIVPWGYWIERHRQMKVG